MSTAVRSVLVAALLSCIALLSLIEHQNWIAGNLSLNQLFSNSSPPLNGTKIILDWTGFWANMTDHWLREIPYCHISDCIVTSDKSKVGQAHAVLFHGRGMSDYSKVPKVRHPWQKYVFTLLESPHHTWLDLHVANFFNFTMTYRTDSDVWWPYYFMKRKQKSDTENFEKASSLVPNKTKMVAQFVSNCHTPSKREAYVRELKKHVEVHVYGSCGHFSCSRDKSSECEDLLKTKYRFYLAFENSVCNDYVTEKFFRIEHFVVPIVLRAKDYRNMGIPDGAYIAADQFSSPKALAQHLKFLAANEAEYLKYFEWMKDFQVAEFGPDVAFCKLCQMLHQKDIEHKSYADLHNWWHTKGDCRTNFAQILARKH